jgi:amino acid adenylation domain-containing protein
MPTRTAASLFASRVGMNPDHVALICDGRAVSYAELDAASNRFARRLQRRNVARGSVVALDAAHSVASVAALLGIVKCGAAFVAIAPSDPAARTADVFADSGATVLITDRVGFYRPGLAVAAIDLSAGLRLVEDESPAAVPDAGDTGDLFQIVYTSGSTGRPKGVLVPTSAILYRHEAMLHAYPFRPGDVGLVYRSLSVIGASWECLGPLLSGVPSVVVRDFDPGVPAVWRQLCEHGVTHVAAAPAMWDLLLEQHERRPGEWRSLRFAIVGGQTIDSRLVRRWTTAFPNAVLLNVYGASECVYPTAHEVSTLSPVPEHVPAGRPFPHVDLHVLDDDLIPVPDGAVGEVCIGGPCVTWGYVNAPAATAERFVPHPFSATPGAVLFRTGDLGFVNDAGVLHVSGRRDRQIKVHGYRVDLGLVESAMLACEAVAQAAVMGVPDGRGDNRLVAYVVPADARGVSVSDMRASLAPLVPPHMVPSAVVSLPDLPRTRSGKVDYQRLPRPSSPALSPPASPGRLDLVTWLTGVWQDVLDAPAISATDNFFDLGGDSLAAMRIAARVREKLNVDLDLSLIFDAGTVERLAGSLSTMDS